MIGVARDDATRTLGEIPEPNGFTRKRHHEPGDPALGAQRETFQSQVIDAAEQLFDDEGRDRLR